ncbi:uncharacterized protein LOC123318336 [Coccinella septempunctata]|uniref:uncharacterized protein LOC123318336 n=1 Tax=Coccinella septempunctata TaxID=41139 RepID=UPI001D0757D0|nr:uncharacterized protein LOC123318336 [Coccinella septempunctata]
MSAQIPIQSSWEEFILPTRIAFLTQEKLNKLRKIELRKKVIIHDLIRNNQSVLDRLKDLRFYRGSHSANLRRTSEILDVKLTKALYIKRILEITVRGKKKKEILNMEISELGEAIRHQKTHRHRDFEPTISPLAIYSNDMRNRGMKRKRDYR